MRIVRLRKNDISAVYELYSDMLYRLALSHLQNSEDAMDAVQDVFLKYTEASPEFKDDNHKKAWLIRTTVNRCYDMLRHKKIRNHSSLDEISEFSHYEDTPRDGEDVFSMLSSLPVKLRTVMTLHYLEGFSVEEVAKQLVITESAVKMRLKRGRELLQGLLKEVD